MEHDKWSERAVAPEQTFIAADNLLDS
jgi:hypothetical protein